MAYIRLDDRFPDHPKVVAAGPEAAYLFIAGLCYCNRYLTDGFIPSEIIPRLTSLDEAKVKQLAKVLLDVRLWHVSSKTPGKQDFEVHDYLDYQNSKERILNIRQARAASGKLGGLAKPKQSAKQNASKSLANPFKEEVRREEVKKEELNTTPFIPLAGDVSPRGETAPKTRKKKQEPEKVVEITEPFIARMVERYSATWAEVEVRERIAESLGHTSALKWPNKELHVQGWLRRDLERLGGNSNGKFRPNPQKASITGYTPGLNRRLEAEHEQREAKARGQQAQ